jgi:hypothetical protein
MELGELQEKIWIGSFPDYLRSILAKLEGTFHTEQAEELGRSRLKYMKSFLKCLERQLNFEA